MPTFRITVLNRDFSVSSDSELPGPDEALEQALKGALQIGTDEVRGGKHFFGAEVTVECDGETVERLMVAIGATPLK
jgi:hypothetical protein